MSNLIPRCSCVICHKEYSQKGIHTHYITVHTEVGIQNHLSASMSHSKATGYKLARRSFIKNIIKWKTYYTASTVPSCTLCGELLDWFRRSNTVCSHSCSAKSSNKARIINGYNISEAHKNKIKNTWSAKHPKKEIYP